MLCESVGEDHRVLLSTDDDGALGVVYDIVTDTAHDGTPHRTQSSRTHHYHGGLLLGSNLNKGLTGLRPEHRYDLARNMQAKANTVKS